MEKIKKFGIDNLVAIILCILLLPFLVVNTTLIVKGAVNNEAVPMFNGHAPMIVLSDSMYPEIKSGDLIVIQNADPEDVSVGDTISFFDPQSKTNSVVTHRVVEIVEQDGELAFRTKGDANNAVDLSLVPASKLIGTWTGKAYSGIGNIALFLQSTTGLIVCIGIPILLLVGFELLRQRKHEAKDESEKEALLAELEELRALKAQKDAESVNTVDSNPEEPRRD